MPIITRIDAWLTRVVNVALVALFALMMGLAVLQVLLRYFFNSGILWGDIAARTLVIWVGLLGATLAIKEEKHFHLDLVTRFLSPRYKRWLQILSHCFALVICYLLGRAGLTFVELDSGSKTFLSIPSSVIDLIIPVAFFLMTIQFGLRAILAFMGEAPVEKEAAG